MSAVQRFPEPTSSARNAERGVDPGAESDPLGPDGIVAER